MLDRSINLLEELDNISRVHWLERDEIDTIMTDFASQIVFALKIERINVWLFNMERTSIISIGEYDTRTKEFKKDTILPKSKYPVYFKALEENKVIQAENIHTNRLTKELSEDYAKPTGVESLMDVPLRIAGELVGVICFEKVGERRRFSPKEKSFAVSVSMVLASNLEARHRRAAQHKLDKALAEKDLLIKEINHRVKNNFSILISLLRLSREKGNTADPKIIFEEYEQRIMAMVKIHDLLCHSKNQTSVNLTDYLNELIVEFKRSYPEIRDGIVDHIDIVNSYLPTKGAIHIGLTITEIMLNSIKYGTVNNPSYRLFISLSAHTNGNTHIKIGDNGQGFDFYEKLKKDTLGLHIIKDLAEGMDLICKYPSPKDNMYEFILPAN